MSDSLGETAAYVVRAAASQFNGARIDLQYMPYVVEESQVDEVVEEASRRPSIIAYTLVLENVKQRLVKLSSEKGIPTVDIIGPVIEALSKITKTEPRLEPGLLRRMDADYYHKMETIEFAVRYDDGKDPRGFLFADVVLLGVSRTSKTPVSMYLAHRGLRVANAPLVPEVSPCDEFKQIPREALIGLTIEPQQLYQIRQERLKSLGLAANADYANMERIYRELDYANTLMDQLGCTVIDVTNRAVEETANRIIEVYRRGHRNAG